MNQAQILIAVAVLAVVLLAAWWWYRGGKKGGKEGFTAAEQDILRWLAAQKGQPGYGPGLLENAKLMLSGKGWIPPARALSDLQWYRAQGGFRGEGTFPFLMVA